MSQPANSPLTGVLWMVLTGLCFVGVMAVVKHLGPGIPPAQSAFLRYVLGLVFLVPMLGALGRMRLSRLDLGLFALRGAVHTGGVILWFYAMTRITIAEVTAMNYISPVYVTLGAALFLGERLAARRILAVIAALIGALIVLRPGVRDLDNGHLAMLVTPILFAVGYLIAKIMTERTSPTIIVAMLSITVTIGLAPFAFVDWVPVTSGQVAWLFLVAAFATAGHYTMTMAFRAAPVSVTQPVTFLQLVWATLMGVIFFHEPADGWVILGGMTIIASISYISWREARVRRREITPPQPATKF